MNDKELTDKVLWDTLDFLAEHPFAPAGQVICGMKDMILRDPEGAARRAAATPSYDHGRYLAWALGGDEDKPSIPAPRPPAPGSVTAGGDEQQEQPRPEPQAPPEPYWPVDPSYTRPDTEPADPEGLLVDCA